MKPLDYDFKRMCRHNRDGSFATQANRQQILRQCAQELREMGFKHLRAQSLKPKHVHALVNRWLENGKSAGTIKNRMAVVRWWAEHVDKLSVVPSNDALGIERRVYTDNVDRSLRDVETSVQAVADDRIRVSLRLQEAFGLRREESLKIQPGRADEGDVLRLQDSWCKGGRERVIPIRTDEQRQVLEEAKALVGKESMIPPDKTYREHLQRYKHFTRENGLGRTHGFRHAWAQDRYREITGFDCPARGGLSRAKMSHEARVLDDKARQTVSRELGHERISITTRYLGR